jgi:hypothetical protein
MAVKGSTSRNSPSHTGEIMYGMFGQPVMNDLARANKRTESFGPSSTMQMAAERQNAPSSPMGKYQSPSQGLFAAYMQNLFQQKYRPQQALGGYQNFGGYGGFTSPMMPAVNRMQPNTGMPMMGSNPYGINDPNGTMYGANMSAGG